ncbi:hypothetical protein CsSME_00048818 [Camellia sinensis var. sinensis]
MLMGRAVIGMTGEGWRGRGMEVAAGSGSSTTEVAKGGGRGDEMRRKREESDKMVNSRKRKGAFGPTFFQ